MNKAPAAADENVSKATIQFPLSPFVLVALVSQSSAATPKMIKIALVISYGIGLMRKIALKHRMNKH